MITFVPTPIGNPQDITLRACKAFEKATLFFCEDTRETKRLIYLLTERYDLAVFGEAKFVSFHEHNGPKRLREYAEQLRQNEVVYVSDAGMPAISDPGQLLVEYCQKEGIAYDVLPGASAVTTAYAASGFEGGKFLFLGFLPHKGSERSRMFERAMRSDADVVLYESPHRLEKLLEQICYHDPERELFVAKELSKKFQGYWRDSAQNIVRELSGHNIRGEWVVIIKASEQVERTLSLGEVIALDLPPKPKAKLLAKLSDKSVKAWYGELVMAEDKEKKR